MGAHVHLLPCRWGGVIALELWGCQNQKWLCGELSFLYPESPQCPSLSSKESTANCMWNLCEAMERHLSPSLGPSGTSHQGDSVPVRGVTCCVIAVDGQVFLHCDICQALQLTTGLSSECPGIARRISSACFLLLYILASPLFSWSNSTYSKTHIYQGSQHAIAHPCHKSQCPTPSHDKSNCERTNPRLNVMFGCFVSRFPGRLRSVSFFSGEQSQSPSWLRGDFRPGAEEPSSAAALLSLKLRFLAVVHCGTAKINCFRTQSVLAPTQEEWGTAKKVPPSDPLGTGCSHSAQCGFQDRKDLPVKTGVLQFI